MPVFPDSLLYAGRLQNLVFENSTVFGRTNSPVKNNAFSSIFDYLLHILDNDFLCNSYYKAEAGPVNPEHDEPDSAFS